MKLYETLGLQPDASKDDIRKAYKKLVVQHHPDKGGDEVKFKEIAGAYETLSDDRKRQMYNTLGDEGFDNAMSGGGGGGGHGGGFGGMHPFGEDMFAQMFGNAFGGFGVPRPPQNVRRGDHNHSINISMEQAFHGMTKNVRINLRKPCLKCMSTCNTCQGRGHITDMIRNGIFTQTMTRACHVCQGTGKQQQRQLGCGNCNGVGHTSTESVHDLKIPAGVHSGFTIRLERLGEQPQDNGETPGDMVVHIVVDDHPKFMRTGDKGRDLAYKQTITFAESVIGKTFVVPHFAEPLTINSADLGIIVPGKDYLYPGKGMTKTGNLHVMFDIKYSAPGTGAVLTQEERDIIKEAFAKCPSLSS